MFKRNLYIFIIGLACSCKKGILVSPPDTQLVRTTVFSSDATATAAISGLYSSMMEGTHLLSLNLSLYNGLSADEFVNYSATPDDIELFQNALTAKNDRVLRLWKDAYQYIYQANAILEGLSSSAAVSKLVKVQLTGEAKFIRAISYFYLVNLFGDVPLITTTGYLENAKSNRSAANTVYDQVVNDLLDAQTLLSDDYFEGQNPGSAERVRPNKATATALLARVDLFIGHWNDAVAESDKIIAASGIYELEADINNVFLSTSREAIWQLKPVFPGLNTWEGYSFKLESAPSLQALSLNLVNAFDSSDKRKQSWIASYTDNADIYYYPVKYKLGFADDIIEYTTVFRLAEIYLIRAEARLRLNDLQGAVEDINIIRNRAGLDAIDLTDRNAILDETLMQYQKEYFAEFGNRWMMLKHFKKAEAVLSVIKGSSWQSSDTLYPIPLSEIQNDPALVQNPGY